MYLTQPTAALNGSGHNGIGKRPIERRAIPIDKNLIRFGERIREILDESKPRSRNICISLVI